MKLEYGIDKDVVVAVAPEKVGKLAPKSIETNMKSKGLER